LREFTRKQLIDDFDFMIKTFEEVHPDIYAVVNKDETKKRIDGIRKTLKDEMTIETFYKKIGKVAPPFKDGHTFISIYQSLQLDEFQYFPLSLLFNKNKAIITFDFTNSLMVNDEVLSINYIDMENMIQEMLQYISTETETFKYASLSRSFHILFSILFGIHSPFKVKFKRNGKIFEKTIKGLTSTEFKELAKKNPRKIQSQKESFRIEEKIGFLNIPTFGYYKEEGEKFKKFIDQSFTNLKSNKIKNLIIDVRNNGGGHSELAKYIASYLTLKPIFSFNRILWKSSQQIRDFVLNDVQNDTHGYYAQKDYDNLLSVKLGECYHWDCKDDTDKFEKKQLFKGNVFVLSNALCYSSTTDFLAMIRDFDLGKIVGTPTGGNPNSFGDCYFFNLPNTKLHISVSQKLFVRPSGDEKENDLTPDYVVVQTDEDRKREIDTVMKYAKKLCQKKM